MRIPAWTIGCALIGLVTACGGTEVSESPSLPLVVGDTRAEVPSELATQLDLRYGECGTCPRLSLRGAGLGATDLGLAEAEMETRRALGDEPTRRRAQVAGRRGYRVETADGFVAIAMLDLFRSVRLAASSDEVLTHLTRARDGCTGDRVGPLCFDPDQNPTSARLVGPDGVVSLRFASSCDGDYERVASWCVKVSAVTPAPLAERFIESVRSR